MKTYYIVAALQLPGFNGHLPYLYNATYKSIEQAIAVKEQFESFNPKATYVVAKVDLPVHPGDNLDFLSQEDVHD